MTDTEKAFRNNPNLFDNSRQNKMIYAHILPEVDPKEIADSYKHVEEGVMTLNQARAAFELPPLEEFQTPRILDSGNRREFASGAVRDIQEGKGRCDLLPLDVVACIINDDIMDHIDSFQKIGNVMDLYAVLEMFASHWDDGLTKASAREIDIQHHCTMLLEVAKHFEEGCKKYGENNWQKGIPVHCYIDSAVRHYLKFLRGDKDEPHDRAFCWNIMCAIWTCKHKPELNEYAINSSIKACEHTIKVCDEALGRTREEPV